MDASYAFSTFSMGFIKKKNISETYDTIGMKKEFQRFRYSNKKSETIVSFSGKCMFFYRFGENISKFGES